MFIINLKEINFTVSLHNNLHLNRFIFQKHFMTLQAEHLIINVKEKQQRLFNFFFFKYISSFILLSLNHICCVFVFQYVECAAVVVFACERDD